MRGIILAGGLSPGASERVNGARSQEGRTPAAQPSSRSTARDRLLADIKPIDALLFAPFALDRIGLGPVPFGVAWVLVLGAVGLARGASLRVERLGLLVMGYVAVLVYLGVVSQVANLDWRQRALRFAILIVLVWIFATGRFDPRSCVLGLAVGLGLNAAAFYLRLTPNYYPPFLTGWLADKNVAGMWYAVVAILGLMLVKSRSQAILWLLASGAILYLTGSRTSLSGFVAAAVWWALRNRTGPALRIGLGLSIYYVLNTIEENFARIGVYSDRDGTDWFRAQVDSATQVKVAGTPWYGRGLTEAWIWYSPTRRMWFHDSYAALFVEGGYVLLIAALSLYVLIAGGLLQRGQVDHRVRATEAAVVVVMVCAWKLGEVFFTTIGFIVLGCAIAARYGQPVATHADESSGQPAPVPP